jgi:uncharacterized protein YecT (DUF1311 family)
MPNRIPVALLALMISIPACASLKASSHGDASNSSAAPGRTELGVAETDCDTLSVLTDKRACYGIQDEAAIDECERIRPLHCKPYRDMHRLERELTSVELASIESAKQAYADYADGDTAYLSDLDSAAREANRAWHNYREAQCALEPFAQGMSRTQSEDLTEACRAGMTRARIDQIKALYAPVQVNRQQP